MLTIKKKFKKAVLSKKIAHVWVTKILGNLRWLNRLRVGSFCRVSRAQCMSSPSELHPFQLCPLSHHRQVYTNDRIPVFRVLVNCVVVAVHANLMLENSHPTVCIRLNDCYESYPSWSSTFHGMTNLFLSWLKHDALKGFWNHFNPWIRVWRKGIINPFDLWNDHWLFILLQSSHDTLFWGCAIFFDLGLYFIGRHCDQILGSMIY